MVIVRKNRVAIIGGGYAGMACAVELTKAGIPVTVFEASRVLGGRARRVDIKDLALDNGQHLLIAAYRELLRLMALVHDDITKVIKRRPLQLLIHGGAQLNLPALPAPLDGVIGLLRARGLSLSDKWASICLLQWLKSHRFDLGGDQPLAEWLEQRQQPQRLIKGLWEPLCLAALNTPLTEASAQVFANVLRDSLLGGTGAADLVLPLVDLSALFPDPAAAFVTARGGRIDLEQRISAIGHQNNGWRINGQDFDQVVIAVGPHHAASLLAPFDSVSAQLIEQFDYQSITTVWLQYAPTTTLPHPMLGLNTGLVQWVFDRGQMSGEAGLLAAVISVDGPHLDLSREALVEAVVQQLAVTLKCPTELLWSQVIIEKRATFACKAGLKRPSEQTAVKGLWLAGDYVASDYPATLEGAVRSGVKVAQRILEEN